MRYAALFILASLALAACEKTGSVRRTDGGGAGVDAGDAGPDVDGGSGPEALRYTPAGCGYEVSTPELPEARMGGNALGSAPTPGYIHASFVGPTESSFTVNWRTDVGTTWSQAIVGTDQAAVMAADGAGAGVTVVEGHQMLFSPIVGDDIRLHETHVCGLTPSTAYYYKVGGPGAWSEVFDIATAPDVGATEPFRFAVAGDSRNDSMVWAETQRAIQGHDVDFQLFSGDAVVFGPNQSEWDGFFGFTTADDFSVVDVLARMALMPANGNHDGLALNYVLQFAVPQELSTGELAQGEQWYSFDYGNAHFVVLDDSAGDATVQGVERDFLEADLAAVDRAVTPWVFVMHHQPPYSCSTNHGSDLVKRAAWQPLYDTHEVDFVLNGHDHDYERSLPIRGFREGTNDGVVADTGVDGIPVDQSGTVYVVAAGAGAPLYGVDPSCYHTHATESTRNFVVIDVDDNTLHFAAYRLDGTPIDEFTYTK